MKNIPIGTKEKSTLKELQQSFLENTKKLLNLGKNAREKSAKRHELMKSIFENYIKENTNVPSINFSDDDILNLKKQIEEIEKANNSTSPIIPRYPICEWDLDK